MKFLRTSMICFFIFFSITSAFPDHGDHDGKHGKYEKKSRHDERKACDFSKTPTSEVYTLECGACHLAYSPGLLPAASWRAILDLLPVHFGDGLQVDAENLRQISDHLQTYAGDEFDFRKKRETKRGNNDNMPLRITQTHLFIREHHELGEDIFQRPSVGSQSNCTACHPSAGEGVYDEKQVMVPQQ